jgi:hypothetical protein
VDPVAIQLVRTSAGICDSCGDPQVKPKLALGLVN